VALAGVSVRLRAAIEVLPPAHGAFLRLLCGAVVARWDLVDEPRAWFPGFAVYGEPGTCKTALGEMVCWIFGWDQLRHVLELLDYTGAELVGHRVQAPGGGWRFDRASYVDLPFVMLDEFHEGEPDVRKRADTAYLGGHARVLYYDDEILVRPTILVGYNPREDGSRVLNRRLPRRAVRLNAGDVPPPWLEAAVEGLFDSDPGPPIALEALSLPARHLDKGQRDTLRSAARALTKEGKAAFGVRVLEPCVLGWAALCGVAPGEPLMPAMIQVAMDYLTCAETLGLAVPDWRSRVAPGIELARAHPDAPGREIFEAAWMAGEEAATARAAERKRTEGARAADDLGLVRSRAELAAELAAAERAIRQVPEPQRTAAAGLRAALRRLRDQAGDEKLAARLEEVRIRAAPVLAEALGMRRGIDDAKAQKMRQETAEAEETKRQKAAARNRAAATRRARAEAKAALAPVRAAARKPEGCYGRAATSPGKPLTILRELRINGHAVIAQAQAPEPGQRSGWDDVAAVVGFMNDIIRPDSRADHGPPPGWWRSTADPGAIVHSSELERWGPGTRAILAPALRALHAEEDRLMAIAGVPARAGRPALEDSSPARLAAPRPGTAPARGPDPVPDYLDDVVRLQRRIGPSR
jgi:hypothetical protein